MNFETTFKENRQVLLNLAKANSLKCGNMITMEDFYSQGCEIFIKCFNRYKPNKAQFNTYFVSSCKGFFKGMIVRETIRQINNISINKIHKHKKGQILPIYFENNNLKNKIHPERQISFMDAMRKLSSDAVEVVMLVLKTPSDFVDDLSKSTIRSFFINHWKGEGAQDRVKFAFSEIKETLNDF